MREQIIEMLSNGIPATAVAAAVGCDDSYVSQICAEEGVAEQIAANKAARFSSYIEHDKNTDSAEELALEKVKQLIPFITKPAEAALVYKTLNTATRRTTGAAQATPQTAAVVNIHLPAAAAVQFQLNGERQVIDINGRSMVTMQAKTLVEQVEQRRAVRALQMNVPATLGVTELFKTKGQIPLVEKL